MCEEQEKAAERAGEVFERRQGERRDAVEHSPAFYDADRNRPLADRRVVAVAGSVGRNSVLTDEQIIAACDKEGLGPCLGLAVGRAIERLAREAAP